MSGADIVRFSRLFERILSSSIMFQISWKKCEQLFEIFDRKIAFKAIREAIVDKLI